MKEFVNNSGYIYNMFQQKRVSFSAINQMPYNINPFIMKKSFCSNLVLTLLVAASLALSCTGYASGFLAGGDIEGSSDHPLFDRFPGSVIYAYDFKEYDEYVLPVAPVEGSGFDAALTDVMRLEGSVTKIQYRVDNRSTVEVYQNYLSAVKDAGFELIMEEAGNTFTEVYGFVSAFYNQYSGMRAASTRNPSFGAGDNFRYLAAELDYQQARIYVSLYVTTRGQRTTIQLDIIESGRMETGLIRIDAEYLLRQLENQGFVVLSGVYFETGRAELSEDSREALEEIASLAGDNPGLDFYIVGHTDNTGSYDLNLELSMQRAKAVADELIEGYGIDPARLMPVGVGPVSPSATNSTEEGRAENRRVELVIR